MKQKKLILIFSLSAFLLFAFVAPVFAGSITGQIESFGGQIGASRQNLPEFIALIIRSLLGILGLIFFIIILYGGWLYMTSQGAEDKIKKAKETLTTAVIGLIIIFAAYAIASFVTSAIINSSGATGTYPSGSTPGTVEGTGI